MINLLFFLLFFSKQ